MNTPQQRVDKEIFSRLEAREAGQLHGETNLRHVETNTATNKLCCIV
jgi:hypothetical protein